MKINVKVNIEKYRLEEWDDKHGTISLLLGLTQTLIANNLMLMRLNRYFYTCLDLTFVSNTNFEIDPPRRRINTLNRYINLFNYVISINHLEMC